jgi:Holliday junction DNA helicase RuvA
MITKLTGIVNRVLDDEVRLQVGALEYQVLVPEFIRRTVQNKVGDEITFHTSHYFEGNPAHGRMVPRLIGFLAEAEEEFFDLFCTVDKVGVRKAMKAFVRPIKEIADAIQRQDAKWLTTLPGIGAATAEQIVATLRRRRRPAASTATCSKTRIKRSSASAIAHKKRAIGSIRRSRVGRVSRLLKTC